MFAAVGFACRRRAEPGHVFAQLGLHRTKGEAHSAKAGGRDVVRWVQPDAALVIPFLPSINGLGQFGGFTYELLDQTGGADGDLERAQQLIAKGNQRPGPLRSSRSSRRTIRSWSSTSTGAGQEPAWLGDYHRHAAVLLGSSYVNDFDFNNRRIASTQADRTVLIEPPDIERHSARTAQDGCAARDVVSVKEATAPKSINHYNLFRSAEINGSAAPGFSSGQALTTMSALSDRELPQGMSYAWSGLSLEEIKAGSQSARIFGLGLLLVYLTLAAQYESVTLPFIILLSVPLAIMGALLAQWGRGLIDDVYCQIGLVMLIGLSAKNGILVVEFAEQLRARGLSIAEAAVEAARIRLRPILMTSLAFILGVMPLVVASGAGREARHSVGTAVVGGMIASTFLNLALIPVLYVVVKSLTEWRRDG